MTEIQLLKSLNVCVAELHFLLYGTSWTAMALSSFQSYVYYS